MSFLKSLIELQYWLWLSCDINGDYEGREPVIFDMQVCLVLIHSHPYPLLKGRTLGRVRL